MELLSKLSNSIEHGNSDESITLIIRALDNGVLPREIVDRGLIPGMDEIGEKFSNHEAFVPEMLLAARAMSTALEFLEPYLVKGELVSAGTLVIGTVKGDMHDIGKNLAAIMFKGAGFNVVDLGVDVPADRFLEAAKEHQADIVGLSALLSTTLKHMKETVELIKNNGIKTTIMIGGAAVTKEFADVIGADGYAHDAASAVKVAQAKMTE